MEGSAEDWRYFLLGGKRVRKRGRRWIGHSTCGRFLGGVLAIGVVCVHPSLIFPISR
jgi:hypothetical protein